MFKPYLRGLYEAVRYYPSFDSDGMTQAKDIDNIDIKGLITEEKSSSIETERGDEDETEQIRADGEGLSEGSRPREIPATEEGELPEPILPGTGGAGIRGEGESDSGRDEGLRGERDRDQRPSDYTITASSINNPTK